MNNSIINLTQPKQAILEWLIVSGLRKLEAMNVVLKQAAKNLGLVTLHPHVYHRMVLADLEDRSIYEKVPNFPINSIQRRMQHILYLSSFSQRRRAELLGTHASNEAAQYYVIPKIHKKKFHASRPIAAQHSCILAPLSKELARVLSEDVKKIP